MKFLRNECKKSIGVGSVVAMLLFFLIGNVLIYWLFDNQGRDWKKLATEEKEFYLQAMEQMESLGEQNMEVSRVAMEQIAIIDYSLEHDIPYQSVSVYENIARNGMLGNFVVIIIALVVYNLICVEFSNNTWKNVVIFNSGNYKKIFVKKRLVSYVVMLGIILVFILISVVFGAVVYKDWSNVELLYQNGAVVETTHNKEIINMVVNVIVRGCFYSGLSILLAAILKDKKIGIVALVLISVFEGTIFELLQKYDVSKLLPFHNLNVLGNVSDYKIATIGGAVLIIAAYMAVMEVASYFVLKKSAC